MCGETSFSLTLIQQTRMTASHCVFEELCGPKYTVVDDQFEAAIWLLWHSTSTPLQLQHGDLHGCQV